MNHVLITGASGNLGQALVRKFLNEGFRVTGTLVPNDTARTEIVHPAFETREADLLDENAAATLVQSLEQEGKGIGALVCTVGGFAMGSVAETGTADVLKQIRLNFETAYNVVRPVFMQMMKKGSGRIFLVGARPGLSMKNSRGMTAYGLSKSLVFRLAELLNEEAKGTQVVTSVIVPSTIDTPQNRRSMPDADFSKWVTPDEIASAIYFYCTPGASILREPVIKVYGNS